MHDQPKLKQKETDEVKKARKEEERIKGELYEAQMASYHAKEFSIDALEKNRKLLLEIPEAYTFYNYEREILEHLFTRAAGEPGGLLNRDGVKQTPLDWLREELILNSAILRKDYKIYAAFVHRHWIFDRLVGFATEEAASAGGRQTANDHPSGGEIPLEENLAGETIREGEPPLPEKAREEPKTSTPSSAPLPFPCGDGPYARFLVHALEKEKAECEKLLRLDERNFHAWNHRRWVLAKCPPPSTEETEGGLFAPAEAAEMRFTAAVIGRNFSNYSAWHQRAITLQAALRRQDRAGGLSPAARDRSRAMDGARSRAPTGDSDPMPPYPSWLPRPSSSSSFSSAPRAIPDGVARELLDHLSRDFDLLVQAIYCDPNDQAAWFYAAFVGGVFHRYEPALRATSRRAAAADPLDGLTHAAIDLLLEERRLGEADACCLPYHFLLSHLARLSSAAGSETIATRLRGYVARLSRAVFSSPALVDGEAGAETDAAAAEGLQRCFTRLHAQLVRVDPLRKGMYDELLSIALK